jgi:hypothetical protein
MKEIDDTPVPENESEDMLIAHILRLDKRIAKLEVQIANLETRKNWQSHQEENDDPEWYA